MALEDAGINQLITENNIIITYYLYLLIIIDYKDIEIHLQYLPIKSVLSAVGRKLMMIMKMLGMIMRRVMLLLPQHTILIPCFSLASGLLF